MCTHTSICELWTALLNLFGSTSLDHHGRLLSLSRTCHVLEREGSERERERGLLAPWLEELEPVAMMRRRRREHGVSGGGGEASCD
jgi:hypothetical protein